MLANVTVHYSILVISQYTSVYSSISFSILQYVPVYFSILQYVLVYYGISQYTSAYFSISQYNITSGVSVDIFDVMHLVTQAIYFNTNLQ